MKKIYQLASVLALASPLVFGANIKEVTAQVVEEQKTEESQTKEDLTTKVKKLHNYISQKAKGNFFSTDLEQGKLAVTRFVHENTGYAVLAFDTQEIEGVAVSEGIVDGLLVITHTLEQEHGVYTAYSSIGDFRRLEAAEKLSYTAQQNEELLPPDSIFMLPPMPENTVTEKKLYVAETNQVTEGKEYKEAFEAEFEKTIDKLIEFYETE